MSMFVNDPIADALTRIRNATMVGHEKVVIPHSTMKEAIIKILGNKGLIRNYKVIENSKGHKSISILLKYFSKGKKTSVIRGLKRVSKPGRKCYVNADKIPRVLNGLGFAVISTSSGILTDKACRDKRIGGEVLCLVW